MDNDLCISPVKQLVELANSLVIVQYGKYKIRYKPGDYNIPIKRTMKN